MTARLSKKITATGRESSEPLLRLYGKCPHSFARTAPTITMDIPEMATLPYVSCEGVHGVPTNTVDRDHPKASCFPLLAFQGSRMAFDLRFCLLSEVSNERCGRMSRVQTPSKHLHHGWRLDSPSATAMECSTSDGRT